MKKLPSSVKNLRICMVSEELIIGPGAKIPGGIGQYILRYSQVMKARGNQVTIVCRADESFDVLNQGIRAVGLTANHVPWSLSLLLWLLKQNFDVIEVPDWGGQGFLAAALLPNSKGIVITRGHGHSLLVQRAHERPEKRGRQFYREWLQVQLSDGVLANSDFLRDLYEKDFGLKRDKVDVCHIGINPLAIGDDEANIEQMRGPIMIYVGGLDYRKGPADLLYVLHRMKQLVPDNETQLLLVGPDTPTGPGKSSYTAYCKTLAEKLGITKQVTFYGLIQREKLGSLYRRASLFVSGSRMESLGIPFLEAMSSGLPVVTWKRGAATEIVVDGETGYLLDFGDIDSFARRALSVLRNPEQWERLSRNGRVRARQHFSEFDLIERQIDWYRRLNARIRRFEPFAGEGDKDAPSSI